MLAQELATLDAQIGRVRQRQEVLEGEMRAVEAELETFSAERQRFDALRDACNAFEKLGALKADDLLWEGGAEAQDAAGHVERARSRVARFEGEIGGILEKQASLQVQINQCLDELNILDEEVRDAYDREERRKQEFVVEREVSSVPYREMIMPWASEAESERRFRRTVLAALFLCFVLGAPILLIKVPMPDRSAAVVEIPERLVELVKKEMPKPAPARKPPSKESPDVSKQAKKEPKPRPDQQKPEPVAAGGGGAPAASKKAEAVGVLKFKNAFKDLMKEIPVARIGTEARLSMDSPQAKGQAVAQRSLVAMQAVGGSSGGIGGAGVSRNVGSGKGRGSGYGAGSGGGYGTGSGGGNGDGSGVGFVRVESSIAGLEESSRPTSDGLGLGRTDEEIQIVFDRYKAALYRIYNQELRKDPTLRGKILMRISIEPDGAVSLCKVESTELASPELVDKIVERIRRFNFGPKEGVKKMTILYPIDFLPAG
ncbi:MAG: AgmX/PglI C-terminal domain-containing protein [Bradyrhizobium sp.]